ARELVDHFSRWGVAEDVGPVDDALQGIHQIDIGAQNVPDVGPLHFYGHTFAGVEHGAVHLAYRGGSERLLLEGEEDYLRVIAKLLLYGLTDGGVAEGRHLIEEHE